jgi:hypothetical protein
VKIQKKYDKHHIIFQSTQTDYDLTFDASYNYNDQIHNSRIFVRNEREQLPDSSSSAPLWFCAGRHPDLGEVVEEEVPLGEPVAQGLFNHSREGGRRLSRAEVGQEGLLDVADGVHGTRDARGGHLQGMKEGGGC